MVVLFIGLSVWGHISTLIQNKVSCRMILGAGQNRARRASCTREVVVGFLINCFFIRGDGCVLVIESFLMEVLIFGILFFISF